jgi:hypothetical protein
MKKQRLIYIFIYPLYFEHYTEGSRFYNFVNRKG